MTNLTRRFFLVGTGAAIAAAAIPQDVLPNQIVQILPPVIDDVVEVAKREIFDMIFYAINPPPGGPDTAMNFTVWAPGRSQPFLNESINVRNSYRFFAAKRGNLFVIQPNEVLKVDWTGVPPGGAFCQFAIEETRADGWRRTVVEDRIINDDGSIASMLTQVVDPRSWVDPDEFARPGRKVPDWLGPLEAWWSKRWPSL
jgi:hypothetical protein